MDLITSMLESDVNLPVAVFDVASAEIGEVLSIIKIHVSDTCEE